MLYRRFGRTNLQMPVLSCGAMRFQYQWNDVPMEQIPDQRQSELEQAVRKALDNGINHIETARGYGSSERQLGEILPRLNRQNLIVQTKVAPVEDAKQFTRDVEDSLRRLKLEYVDLLGLHGINDRRILQWAIAPGGCLAAARDLQKRGLVRHVGFSTHGPAQIILDAVRHEGDGGFDYVNLHWYYIFQRNWPAIAEAKRRDLGVFIISPSDKGGMLYDPPPKLVELCRPLLPAVFNELFSLSRPEVHTLSIGTKQASDFDLHLQILEWIGRTDEVLPPILGRLEQALREAVDPDLADPFNMGLPDWDATPGQINLPVIVWLMNLVAAYDMTKYGQMRYNLLGNGGHWFPGLNAERLDEIDLSPILATIKGGQKIPPLLRKAHQLLYKAPAKRLSQGE